jgi:hypothetical protein
LSAIWCHHIEEAHDIVALWRHLKPLQDQLPRVDVGAGFALNRSEPLEAMLRRFEAILVSLAARRPLLGGLGPLQRGFDEGGMQPSGLGAGVEQDHDGSADI